MKARTRRLALLLLGCGAGCGTSGSSGQPVADGSATTRPTDGNAVDVSVDATDECAAAAWTAMTVPAEAVTDTFVSVAGTGPTDMWTCSTNGQLPPGAAAVHLLHWDGSSLAEAPVPTSCVSLWASAPGEVWAGGAPHYVDHLVEGQWLNVNLGDQQSAFAIWGNRPSNVWFAGVNYNGGHWDGTSLSTGGDGDAAVLDLQGTALWGTGDEDLWLLQGAFPTPGPTSVFRVNEAAVGDPGYEPAASTSALDVDASRSVLAALWAADDAHVWVVGTAGFIGFFDGQSWSVQASPTSRDLAGIWGSSSSDAWAVGAAGTIVHWDGTAWSLASAPVTTNLLAVTGAGPCNVWAVGEGGTVLALRE